jgi:hypothetical protein
MSTMLRPSPAGRSGSSSGYVIERIDPCLRTSFDRSGGFEAAVGLVAGAGAAAAAGAGAAGARSSSHLNPVPAVSVTPIAINKVRFMFPAPAA